MIAKYIFRIDDVCPTMNWKNFEELIKIFDKYKIKPIIGVVPDNKDKKLSVQEPVKNFWKEIRKMSNKGWIIAQHGYQHKYITNNSGIIGLNNYSEFAGLDYKDQYQKILSGKNILEEKLGTKIKWWMAPAHSFDKNTCRVLKELKFEYITDGIALYPFKKDGLIWIPQQLWKPVKNLFGLWTICIHPNVITSKYICSLDLFIKTNYKDCQNINLTLKHSSFNLIYRIIWYMKNIFYRFFY